MLEDNEQDLKDGKFKIPIQLKEPIKKFLIERGNNGLPTLSSHLKEYLSEKYEILVDKSTICRALKRFGFNYSKIICKDKNKKRQDIIKKRKEYCSIFYKYYLANEYDIVYQDESYICKNHVRGKSWALEKDFGFFNKPSGKGQRIVITGVINENGFIKNTYEFWDANNNNSDYHKNFNKEIFEEYFTKKILPNLTKPSLIILDNAPYHKIYENDAFNPRKMNKNELKEYLNKEKINYDDRMLKSDLMDLALKYWKPTSKLEKLAQIDGINRFNKEHKLLFLPPYYPELNPIEFVWARIKNNIADKPSYNMKLLRKALKNSERLIDSSFCESIYNHCFKELLYLMKEDNLIYDNLEKDLDYVSSISDISNESETQELTFNMP